MEKKPFLTEAMAQEIIQDVPSQFSRMVCCKRSR